MRAETREGCGDGDESMNELGGREGWGREESGSGVGEMRGNRKQG